jgi:hypothetical protein
MSFPTALLAAGTGLQAIGMIGQGAAASSQAKGQAAVAEYNAKVAEQEAAAERQANLYRQKKMAESAGRYGSGMRAAYGASGVVPSEGTPLLVQAKQAAEDDLDQLMASYEADISERRKANVAAGERLQAGIYRKSARNSVLAGAIGAGTTLLTGFGNMKW